MNKCLVIETDFGLVDGAVSAMYGVALSIDDSLKIYDLTHEIPPFDTFEASYRLHQAIPFWPKGTTFICVIDPGVGTERKSVVVKTNSDQYIVTPDNGTLSHIARSIGLKEAREISEEVGRRKNSENSETFYGRDVYAYTGALLASGKVSFEDIGPKYPVEEIIILENMYPTIKENEIIGTIETLDVRFGNLWTNISRENFESIGIKEGSVVEVLIEKADEVIYQEEIIYATTFNHVEVGKALMYINSMDHIAIALNQGNFAKEYNIGTRQPWKITLKNIEKKG